MKTIVNQSPFIDIKRNYLIFMEHTLTWFDSNLVRVLFALLMEGDALDQTQIIELTELNRATVSETLSRLTDVTSKFLVLQTRKKGERKKYQCPQKLAVYFRTLLIEGLEVTKFSLEQVPLLIHRLDALPSQNSEILRVRRFLNEYWELSNYFHFTVTYFQNNVDKFVKNPDVISQLIDNMTPNDAKSFNFPALKYDLISRDSLERIKKDFLEDQVASQAAAVGKKKELVMIGLLFYMEEKPLTQDYIIKITGYSRSTVSVTLKTLIQLNILQVIKKRKDRRKFYQIKFTLTENLFNTIKQFRYIFSHAKEIIQVQFQSRLEKIEENGEKEKFLTFLEENIRFFELFEDYTNACTHILQEFLSKHKPKNLDL
ncbi:MAG: MarR family transcriptional regulator [Candidatus Hermodarchaeota archaeon]